MSRDRWSLANTLRLVRAARNAVARAGIRYRLDETVSFRTTQARVRLNEVERLLIDALSKARRAQRERRAA